MCTISNLLPVNFFTMTVAQSHFLSSGPRSKITPERASHATWNVESILMILYIYMTTRGVGGGERRAFGVGDHGMLILFCITRRTATVMWLGSFLSIKQQSSVLSLHCHICHQSRLYTFWVKVGSNKTTQLGLSIVVAPASLLPSEVLTRVTRRKFTRICNEGVSAFPFTAVHYLPLSVVSLASSSRLESPVWDWSLSSVITGEWMHCSYLIVMEVVYCWCWSWWRQYSNKDFRQLILAVNAL